jgi:hypothetical protein
MTSDELVAYGNHYRELTEPEQALAYYGQAFVVDPCSANAFNNYGNTLRELGHPLRAIPFLQHAILLDPTITTARFNLAVSLLLSGDYIQGFSAYESRWQFEHLNDALPNYKQPRWTGQDLKGKKILVLGEQGHGDCIQFSRFIFNLHEQGAEVYLQVTAGLVPLFASSPILKQVTDYQTPTFEFDFWVPIMSIPQYLGLTVNNIPQIIGYLAAPTQLAEQWRARLGPKTRLRVGFCWSGRPDSWIHKHKSVPFETMHNLIKSNPNYEWISLQIDPTPEQEQALSKLGLTTYPGSIQSWADTAALIHNLDVVVGMDTAVSHLSAALGRPTWIMLNQYAVDWRWLLNRDDSPWYPTARLFRQPTRGDWNSVTQKISKFLALFKV